MPLPAAAYSNLALFPPAAPKGGAARRSAAAGRNDQEAQTKRNVERSNAVLDRLEARQAGFAAELKRIQKRKNATAARIERIEDEILTYMEDEKIELLAGIRCTMRAQAAAAALEVTDETLIPQQYMRQPPAPPRSPDKVAIKAALAKLPDMDPGDWGCKLSSKISLIRK
jgi:hypothetical protein